MISPSKSCVVIVGRGKLSSNLASDLALIAKDPKETFSYEVLSCAELTDLQAVPPKSIFCLVHAGSGRLLPELIHFCNLHKTPLIQASTGMNDAQLLPSELSFIFLEAPNLSVSIVKFMHLMEQASKLFSTYNVQIKESHQSAKKSVPVTALVMAKNFGKDLSDVISIRDKQTQLELGIPPAHLNAHAFHWITVQGGGVELSFQSSVLGHKTYSFGLISILKTLHHLAAGRYHVLELMEKGLL